MNYLRFLWKRHIFQRREDLPCTERCIYCPKERHNPRQSDVEDLGFRESKAPPWIIEGYKYRRCKVCGGTERTFIRESAEVGPIPEKWKKYEVKNKT